MKMNKIESRWIIKFEKSNTYLVDVPPTGFKSTRDLNKAIRFVSMEDLCSYTASRGLFVFRPVLCHFDA